MVGRRKKATGTHVRVFSVSYREGVGFGWSAWGQRLSGRGGGGEQLCLEVAPSILIDFICAHVSESERHAARWTERNSLGKGGGGGGGGCFRGKTRVRAERRASERERKKEWRKRMDGWMDGARRRKEKGERKGNNGKREEEETKSESKEREYGRTTTATTDGDGA